jgi:hypothetical protein
MFVFENQDDDFLRWQRRYPDDPNLQHYYHEPRLGGTMCKTCECREQPGHRA